LLDLVYDKMRRQARGYLRKQRVEHTLQMTLLVRAVFQTRTTENIFGNANRGCSPL
jgi:hypothetical protein